jgi:hypothetical protein
MLCMDIVATIGAIGGYDWDSSKKPKRALHANAKYRIQL